ncbi:MAG: hypothetical protein WC773_02665 [Patescibacteria group bacterium]|jgi:hypothetical protein
MKLNRFSQVKIPSIYFLKKLTDQTGIVQHARYDVPDLRYGYCLDDNARALIFASRCQQIEPKNKEFTSLCSIYLGYINLCQREDGKMHNFVSYDRHFVDDIGSEDSFGRAIWGLGEACENLVDKSQAKLAEELLLASCVHIKELNAPRAIAYALCGLSAYVRKNPDFEQGKQIIKHGLIHLEKGFERYSTNNWPWFENILAYSNALIPMALLGGGQAINDQKMIDLGIKSLDWILSQTEMALADDIKVAAPIGSNGWFVKDGERAFFDQQPIDVALTILALKQAYSVTKNKKYLNSARLWFDWFSGKNMVGLEVADPKIGSCFDGLHSNSLNQNRGAESTIMYLLAALEMAMPNKNSK